MAKIADLGDGQRFTVEDEPFYFHVYHGRTCEGIVFAWRGRRDQRDLVWFPSDKEVRCSASYST